MISDIKNFTDSWVYIGLILLTAVFFCFFLKFIQFRRFGQAAKVFFSHYRRNKNSTSNLQAVFVSLSARMGTGNIVGVAAAIIIGGPGALLWMWIFCLISMPIVLVESSLAQLFKARDKSEAYGAFIGGAPYYMLKGLGNLWKWLAVCYAVLSILTKGWLVVTSNMNSIVYITGFTAFGQGYDSNHNLPYIIITVIVIACVLGIIIIGGVQRIIRYTSLAAPLFIVVFLVFGLTVVFSHISIFPTVLGSIFANAFTLQPLLGGTIGQVIKNGIKRGVFSNEAGQGSGSFGAATAASDQPVRQGLGQMFGAFIDTIVICTISGIIFITALFIMQGNDKGNIENYINQIKAAHPVHYVEFFCYDMAKVLFPGQIGVVQIGPLLLSMMVIFFGTNSILGSTLITEISFSFLATAYQKLHKYKKYFIWCGRLLCIIAVGCAPLTVMIGQNATSESNIFVLADFGVALCFIFNIIGLVALSPFVKAVVHHWEKHCPRIRDLTKVLVFDPSKLNIPSAAYHAWQ